MYDKIISDNEVIPPAVAMIIHPFQSSRNILVNSDHCSDTQCVSRRSKGK